MYGRWKTNTATRISDSVQIEARLSQKETKTQKSEKCLIVYKSRCFTAVTETAMEALQKPLRSNTFAPYTFIS
jgi:hypothetical protein